MTRPPVGPGGCRAHSKTTGRLCGGKATAGTDLCRMHGGTSPAVRARGQVVRELQRWGLDTEQLRDPGVTLLQLMTQSAMRVEFYASLLAQAYDAAERLRTAGTTDGALPGHADNPVDEERAIEDLDRVFATGGVAALIGIKWGAAGKDGHLFQVEEGIRGLVRLEAEERDRCAGMAAKAVAAGLAERQVRLAEQMGAQLATVIRDVLSAHGIDPATPESMRITSERLHALAAA